MYMLLFSSLIFHEGIIYTWQENGGLPGFSIARDDGCMGQDQQIKYTQELFVHPESVKSVDH